MTRLYVSVAANAIRKVMFASTCAALAAALAGCWGGDGGPAPTSTVGGTITGLITTGLVLANGMDTVSPAAGASSFTFSTPVSQGSSYAVTVQAQPAGATCTIANGSGTVDLTAVSNVQVTCATSLQSIGGSISGLTGSGLVLANGTDSTSPAAGAPGFTFAAMQPSGSSYAVSVKTQPVGETCSVGNATGTVGNAPVTTVLVSCAPVAHTLGGTVSGFSAGSLVLANGNDSVTLAAGALAFTFTQPVAEGGGYAVTVTTQPAGTQCSVANGMGTMGTADVSNVQVTCSAQSYSVGGSISGLAVAGLVLANGGDTVSPAANATSFVFATKVAFGASYSVAVQQQPVGLTCTVSGTYPATMGAGNVTGIVVTCGPHAATVSAFVGNGTCGHGDGSGGTVEFDVIDHGGFDSAGNLYVADSQTNTVRKITPAGVVTTLAGNPAASGLVNGTGGAAEFFSPDSAKADASGNVYVGDQNNRAVRKITPAGVVTTLAGTGTFGYVDGPGSSAQFDTPGDVVVDASGNVYVTDGTKIRKIAADANADVTTFAGIDGSIGLTDGGPGVSTFISPLGLAVDAAGNVYVADANAGNIRKITPAGVTSTLAGPSVFPSPLSGFVDGAGSVARFAGPRALAIDAAGNLYVADRGNSAIRKVTPAGVVSTVISGLGAAPNGIEIDAAGNLYVNDQCAILKISP